MTTNWERRIAHITRLVKPTALREVRGRQIKAEVKRQRGLPSRNLPGELVFERLRLEYGPEAGEPQTLLKLDRLRLAEIHDRLLERKRSIRDAARRLRRPSVNDTKINLWRRRREWLLRAERDPA
jgi:hypothetical protein